MAPLKQLLEHSQQDEKFKEQELMSTERQTQMTDRDI